MNLEERQLVETAVTQLQMAKRRIRPEDATDGRYMQALQQVSDAVKMLDKAILHELKASSKQEGTAMTDVQPIHGYNGFVAVMRSATPRVPRSQWSAGPAYECLVEVRDVGIVSAWVDGTQRETRQGEVLWVWRRQIIYGGNGRPLVRGPCELPRTYVPGEPTNIVEKS